MAKNIIITCGTSLISNLFNEDFYLFSGGSFSFNDIKNFKGDVKELTKDKASGSKISIDCDDEMGDCSKEQKFKKYLIEKIFGDGSEENKGIDENSNFFKNLSAEIKTICGLSGKLENSKKEIDLDTDNIYLFYSDTLDGQLVAEVLEEIFIKKLGIKNIKLYKIDGFQTENAKDFQQKAIADFFSKLEKIKESGNETIMCPVGGYKALIPYASLYAMVNGWDIKYIYEDSDEIIPLPSGMLSYMLLKASIKDHNFKDVINNLGEGENSMFSQKVDDFENIVKFAEATNRFIELGDLSGFSNIEFENNEKLNNLIKKFVEFDKKIKFGQIRNKEEISNIVNEIKTFEGDKNNILNPIFKKLKEEFEIFKTKNEIEFYFSILTFYKKHKMYLQGFLFMREFFIDLISYLVFGKIYFKNKNKNIEERGLNTNNTSYKSHIKKLINGEVEKIELSQNIIKNIKYNVRDYIELKILGSEKYFKEPFERRIILDGKERLFKHGKIDNGEEILNMYKNLKDIRNYFAHYGIIENSKYDKFSPQNLEQTFEKYYNLLESFKNYILSQNQN